MQEESRIDGSLFRDIINKLIDTDKRFDTVPEELVGGVGNIDEIYEGDIEVYKYNVECGTF
jgi:hypothetical protein